jgi:Kdo2-lipid IVA lauroyltransferase/acyltransferase
MPSERVKRRNASWFQRGIAWPLQVIPVALAVPLLALMPRRMAGWLGSLVIGLLGPHSTRHARNVGCNLAVAFPDLTPRAARELRRRIWRHVGRVMFTSPHIPPLLRGQSGREFEVDGEHHVEDAASSGAFILVGAHLGHWEMTCGHAALRGYRVSALYTPLPNPWLDRLLLYLRSRGGDRLTLIPRGAMALRQLIGSLRRGEGLFMIVDQRVDGGQWHPFFGSLAKTTTTPARLAYGHNCPIIPCRTIVLPGDRYRISYYAPIRPDLSLPADAEISRIMRSINEMFESWIREFPGQWLCTKRRWPKQPHGLAETARLTRGRTGREGVSDLPPVAWPVGR